MIMPTTSQIKVLDKLNLPRKIPTKSLKRRKTVPSTLTLPKINVDMESIEGTMEKDSSSGADKYLSKIPSLPILPTVAEKEFEQIDSNWDDYEVDGAISKRLHQLGFWGINEKKRKIGVPIIKNVDLTELNNRYTQEIVDGIMEKVKKAAVKTQPPQEIPTALCFSLKGSVASHKDIKDKIEALLYLCRGCKIKSIQFLPLKTRWLVIMDEKEARDRLAGNELDFSGYKVTLRRYDDVASLEYRQYQRANGLLTMVNDPFRT